MDIIDLAKNIFRNLRFTLKNIPKKPVTINYPLERRDIPERFRLGTFGLTGMKIVLLVNYVKEYAHLKL